MGRLTVLRSVDAGAAVETVPAEATEQDVVAGTPVKNVVAEIAVDGVVAGIAEKHVVEAGAEEVLDRDVGVARGLPGVGAGTWRSARRPWVA